MYNVHNVTDDPVVWYVSLFVCMSRSCLVQKRLNGSTSNVNQYDFRSSERLYEADYFPASRERRSALKSSLPNLMSTHQTDCSYVAVRPRINSLWQLDQLIITAVTEIVANARQWSCNR